MEDFNVFEMMLFTVDLLAGFLVNTFAMMWGKWLQKPVTAHGLSTEEDYTKMAIDCLEMVRHGMV